MDAYGNVFASYTGTVSFATNDASGTAPATVTFALSDHGVRVVPNGVLRTASTNAQITVTDNANSFVASQGNIVVTNLPVAAGLRISGATSGAAGHANAVTVTALDPYGNRMTQYRGRVTVTSSDPNAALPAPYTFGNSDQGSHTFANVQLVTVGTQWLGVSDASFNANQTNLVIGPAPAVSLVVGVNQTAVSQVAQNIAVTALDAYGNIDTQYTDTVTLTSSDPMAVLPSPYTYLLLDTGAHNLGVTLASAGAQTITATDTHGVTGTSAPITVTPGATSQLRVYGLTSAAAGQGVSVNVRALDSAGNTTPNYRGTVRTLSSDVQATLPPDTAYGSSDAGVKPLPITFATSGNQSVAVSDITNGSITGNLNNIVVFATPTKLRIIAPAQATAGNVIAVGVQVTDNANNIVTNYSGGWLLTSGDGQATLGGSIAMLPGDHGSKTVTGTLVTATPNQTLTLTDASGNLPSVSVTLQVIANTAAAFGIAAPNSVVAGNAFGITLTALDAYGNIASGYTGTARFSSSDAHATLAGNVTFVLANAGVVNVMGTTLVTADSNATVGANDTLQPSIAGTSRGIAVTPHGAAALVVSGASSGAAGHNNTVAVTVVDMYNNTVTDYQGTVVWSSSDAAASLPDNAAFVLGDAGHHAFAGVMLVTAGTQSITVRDVADASIGGNQNNIVINAGAATHLFIVDANTRVAAGSAQNFVVQARDIYGNIDPNFTGTVTVTSSDSAAVLPTAFTYGPADAGAHVFTWRAGTVGSQTLTVSSGGLVGAQTAVTVDAATTAKFMVTGIANAAAGVTGSMHVQAVDNFNNITPSYRGTVRVTSSDGRAILPNPYTFAAGDAGSQNFVVTLTTQGTQSVTVTDLVDASINGSQNNITVGVQQTQFTVTTVAQATAGVGFNVTVRATDIYGNINAGYAGTLHFTSSDPNATLPADVVLGGGNLGVVTLNQQTILKTASSGQTLAVTDGNFSGSQSGIVVNPGPTSLFAWATPASVTAGAAFSATVTALDAYNNTAVGYVGQVTFTGSDLSATTPGTVGFTSANLGQKTFSSGFRLTQAGAQTLTVTDSNGLISGNTAITVASAAGTGLVLIAPATTIAGSAFNVTLAAQDSYGNVASGYRGTVHWSSTDARVTTPGTYVFAAPDNGNKTWAAGASLATAGLQTLIATDANNAALTPGQAVVRVTPAAMANVTVTSPNTATAATPFAVTISGVDAYGNVVSSYGGNILLRSSDAAGTPSLTQPLTVRFTNGVAAQRTASVTLNTTGAQNVTAQDDNTVAWAGAANVQVAPASAASLALQVVNAIVAGQPNTVVVQALDASGNRATNFVGTVSFSSTDPCATLPPSTSLNAGDQGMRTFSNALTYRQSGSQTLTATASGVTAAQATTVVSAANANSLRITGIADALAGATNTATVRAVDVYGNTAATYAGSVSFTSSDSGASLPGAYTFIPVSNPNADAGSHGFALRLATAGSQSVTVTDVAHGFVATQANIVVNVQRSGLIVTAPTSTQAGANFNITVRATDAYNNLDANYTGTLTFATTNANALLPSPTSVTGANAGQVTLSGVQLRAVSPNATISVSDSAHNLTASSNAIVVTPTAAASLALSSVGTVAAGAPMTVALTALDAYGNVATGYAGTVNFSTNNSNAVLPSSSAFTAGVAQSGNFQLLAVSANSTITATDGSIAGARNGIVVTPLTAHHLTLSGLTSGSAGRSQSLTVVARDIYNNVASAYQGVATFSSTDGTATLPVNTAFVVGDAGTHVFPGVVLQTLGSQSVTATDTATPSITGTESGIVIGSAAATHLTLSAPATTVAGTAQNFIVAAVDAYGNVDPNFAGTVSFTSTDANAIFTASHVFNSSDAGHATVAVTFRIAANQNFIATGPVAVGNVLTPIVVTPATTASLVLWGLATAAAGQAQTLTVRAIDAYANATPGLYRNRRVY